MRRPPKRSRRTKSDELIQAIAPLAARLAELNGMAVRQYTPIVEEILRTGSRNTRHIEWTLDHLLDFCFSDPALQLYRRLCRHYFAIDPAATALYIDAYREMWDSDDEPSAAGTRTVYRKAAKSAKDC